MRALYDAFITADVDHSGSIDRYEIVNLMRSMGLSPTSDEIVMIMKDIDGDDDFSINFREWVEFMTSGCSLKDSLDKAGVTLA